MLQSTTSNLDSFIQGCLTDVAQGKHLTKKKKKKAKKTGKKVIPLKALEVPAKKPLQIIQSAPIVSMVQLMTNTTCLCCGATYRAPNQFLFIKRHHPRYGILYEKVENRLDIEAAILTFPREVEEQDVTTQACAACFNITDLLLQATQPHMKQLDLFRS